MASARQLVRKLGGALVAALLLLLTRRRDHDDETRFGRAAQHLQPAERAAELWTAGLLGGAGLAGAGFVAVYALGANTQLLGLTLGLCLGLAGTGLVVASRGLVDTDPNTEERPKFARPDAGRQGEIEAQAAADAALRGHTRPITRRRLLIAAGGAAGLGIGAAAITPFASLGPRVGNRLAETPWADGVALHDENELPVRPADLEVGSFLTAFAAGADRMEPTAAVMVMRVRPEELELPEERRDWAPGGLLAFSKVCTHAGCAVSLFRYPLSPTTTEAGPALVCPCHYSTFDVLRAGKRIFGPAVRALPQLPLRITSDETLEAAGPLSGPPGPSWSGIEEST